MITTAPFTTEHDNCLHCGSPVSSRSDRGGWEHDDPAAAFTCPADLPEPASEAPGEVIAWLDSPEGDEWRQSALRRPIPTWREGGYYFASIRPDGGACLPHTAQRLDPAHDPCGRPPLGRRAARGNPARP